MTRHMVSIEFANILNPVCGVAAVCYQVRCIRLWHLDHFHRGKIWKVPYWRFIISVYSEICEYVFNIFEIWSAFPLRIYCGFEPWTLLFIYLRISKLLSNSSGNMPHWHLWCVKEGAAREEHVNSTQGTGVKYIPAEAVVYFFRAIRMNWFDDIEAWTKDQVAISRRHFPMYFLE